MSLTIYFVSHFCLFVSRTSDAMGGDINTVKLQLIQVPDSLITRSLVLIKNLSWTVRYHDKIQS